jgi:hypothetical protein
VKADLFRRSLPAGGVTPRDLLVLAALVVAGSAVVGLAAVLRGCAGSCPLPPVGAVFTRPASPVVVSLPAGSTDVLVSRDGRWAVGATVTFNRQRSVPERLVYLIDARAGRMLWRRSLPSASCCAFPVVAASEGAAVIALGGGERTLLYDRSGALRFVASLDDGRLHTAAALSDDGQLLAVGEARGRVAGFRPGVRTPLWSQDLREGLMALALAGEGNVLVAATRQSWLLLDARDGTVRVRQTFGPARIAAAAVSTDGMRAALVWKRQDDVMVVAFIEDGQVRWTRALGAGTVPVLQMDASGRWLAVGDLVGRQAALVSASGRVVWRGGGAGRVAVGVAPQGSQAATARGLQVQIRALPAGRVVGWVGLPGIAHVVRLAGGQLVVAGAAGDEALPDTLWAVPVAAGVGGGGPGSP